MKTFPIVQRAVHVPIGRAKLEGDLSVPHTAAGIVVFAPGSGSSRHSPRNRYVAEVLQEAGLATLLFDLMTSTEEQVDARTAHLRFDIALLRHKSTRAKMRNVRLQHCLPILRT